MVTERVSSVSAWSDTWCVIYHNVFSYDQHCLTSVRSFSFAISFSLLNPPYSLNPGLLDLAHVEYSSSCNSNDNERFFFTIKE